MEEKLIKIEVNLQQSIIWTGKEGVSNAICAITHRNRELVVIRPEYRELQEQILELVGFNYHKVVYGDSFEVDTWDNRVENYLKKCVLLEELQGLLDDEDVLDDAWQRDTIAEAVAVFIQKRDRE